MESQKLRKIRREGHEHGCKRSIWTNSRSCLITYFTNHHAQHHDNRQESKHGSDFGSLRASFLDYIASLCGARPNHIGLLASETSFVHFWLKCGTRHLMQMLADEFGA